MNTLINALTLSLASAIPNDSCNVLTTSLNLPLNCDIAIFSDNIDAIDATEFENKKVIVKGCGHIPLNEDLYVAITKKLQNTVSSLMFGEACSAVPVFKKK